jgi:predicted aspartyl protease
MPVSDWSRRGLFGIAALWAETALAQTASAPATGVPPATDTTETLKSGVDDVNRMTTDVLLDGHGPFPFLVDTGADHSLVAQELASALGLPVRPTALVHGVAGDVTVPSAFVHDFRVGSRGLRDVALPTLIQANLGAAGLLGIDVLQGQRVILDFKGRRIQVSDSARRRAAYDGVIVRARSRFGQLVLVDSCLGAQPILVVIDTGAESSIANSAFRRRVIPERASRDGEITSIFSVTGQSTTGAWAVVPTMQVGGFRLNHVPVVFSDLISFERWRLQNQPALLLGMDVLRLFDTVEIDFARREVRFTGLHARQAPPPRSNPVRLAQAAPGREA